MVKSTIHRYLLSTFVSSIRNILVQKHFRKQQFCELTTVESKHRFDPLSYKHNTQWRSIICKHNARWHHVSRLKASDLFITEKTTNVNKTHQLIPGIGIAILGVTEPHLHK
jgi:hypothetical protein